MRRRSVGYVIQEVGLLPHLTVAANVGIVPRLLGWDETRRNQWARELRRPAPGPGSGGRATRTAAATTATTAAMAASPAPGQAPR